MDLYKRKILKSILDSRIQQYKALIPLTEIKKHRIVDSIAFLEDDNEKISVLLDFLISELSKSQNKCLGDREKLRDYELAVSTVNCKPGELHQSVLSIISEKKAMERINTQDRLLLIRQNEVINESCSMTTMKRQMEDLEKEIGDLCQSMKPKRRKY